MWGGVGGEGKVAWGQRPLTTGLLAWAAERQGVGVVPWGTEALPGTEAGCVHSIGA